jgi:hypothetical protein
VRFGRTALEAVLHALHAFDGLHVRFDGLHFFGHALNFFQKLVVSALDFVLVFDRRQVLQRTAK